MPDSLDVYVGSDDYHNAMAATKNTSSPSPDDLASWKQVDIEVSRLSADSDWFRKFLCAPQAVRRYFGHEDLKGALKRHEQQGVLPAYASWGILDYRPTATSRTRAEIMLDQGRSEAEAILLRARMNAVPGIYRIASSDPHAGILALEGVLQGGSFNVHDKLLSSCVEQNLFLVCRIFRAGNFWLCEMAGPPLGAMQVYEAIEFLRRSGMEFTADGQRGGSHMFGWLWKWSEHWAAASQHRRICNMDGDELLWHTASFSMAQPEQTRQELARRHDIEPGDDASYRWVAKTGLAAKKMGGPVSLGELEFVGDELVLTVNSARRLAAARKWIEAMPGVAFGAVTTRAFNEPEAQRPLDERIEKPESVPMTSEMRSAMESYMLKQYATWLDTPVPVLGGKTPREKCRTPAGRQEVAMLIRTIPDPHGPSSIPAPRAAMLRELGIQDVDVPQVLPAPTFPALGSPAIRYSHVSRNDSCPCGSGRKYKNCCGH